MLVYRFPSRDKELHPEGKDSNLTLHFCTTATKKADKADFSLLPIGYCIVYTPKMAAKKILCFYGIPMNIINLVNGDLVDIIIIGLLG